MASHVHVLLAIPLAKMLHNFTLYLFQDIFKIFYCQMIMQVYKFIWIISGLHVNNKRINNNIHIVCKY